MPAIKLKFLRFNNINLLDICVKKFRPLFKPCSIIEQVMENSGKKHCKAGFSHCAIKTIATSIRCHAMSIATIARERRISKSFDIVALAIVNFKEVPQWPFKF